MSIYVTSTVWKYSPYDEPGMTVTFLALADWSDDDGMSFPSIAKLAQKARLSERQVQYNLRKLEDDGFITVERRFNNSNRYRINLDKLRGAITAPGAIHCTPPVQSIAPYTSLDTSLKENTLVELPFDEGDSSHNDEREAVKRVFAYYLDRVGRKESHYSLSPKRMQKGLARLREAKAKVASHSLEDAEHLMRVIVDTMASSKFHMGDNPNRTRYVEWDKHLFPSAEKFEEWIGRYQEAG